MSRERGRRPFSQVEIEEGIQEDLERLEEATDDYRDALAETAKADRAYKQAWARHFQAANGTRDAKKAFADEQADTEYGKFLDAQAEEKGLYQLLWTIRASMDALRSLNANVREQV